MSKIKIVIERSQDLFNAYAVNVEGIYGMGKSVYEAKESILKSIHLYKKYNKKNLPKILAGEYKLEYKFDVESFLNYYKGIFTNSALERLTGIHQKQIQHYATGLKKPRESQIRKIESAIHQLGNELITLSL